MYQRGVQILARSRHIIRQTPKSVTRPCPPQLLSRIPTMTARRMTPTVISIKCTALFATDSTATIRWLVQLVVDGARLAAAAIAGCVGCRPYTHFKAEVYNHPLLHVVCGNCHLFHWLYWRCCSSRRFRKRELCNPFELCLGRFGCRGCRGP